jgi:cytochrome b
MPTATLTRPEAQTPVVSTPRRIAVWDLPLRVFHWSLVLAVTTALVTGEIGGDWMVWHGRAGIAIVGLLVFRGVWGVVGSTHARFAQFAPTPGKLKAYLRGQWHGLGHNPLGALSVFALLGLLALQAGSGLFGNDDISYTGPLAALLSDERVSQLTGWHKLLANGLFTLLALHLAAIAFHVRVKKHDIVTPMVTGWTQAPAQPAVAAPDISVRRRWPGLVLAVALALGAVALLIWTPWQKTSVAADEATHATGAPVAASQAAPGW